MRYSIPLPANKEVRLPYRGRCLQLLDLGGLETVNLTVEWGDKQQPENMGAVPEKFQVKAGDVFTGLILQAASAVTIDLLVSFHDVGINPVDGSTVSIDPSQLPLPAALTRGAAPGTPLYVAGLAYTPAATVDDSAAVAVNDSLDLIVGADAARIEIRFRNNGVNAVALGSSGLTWAKRSVVLEPGDVWVEVNGAALAWYGITDAGNSASVTAQELTV